MAEITPFEMFPVDNIEEEDPSGMDFDLPIPAALVSVKMELESDEDPGDNCSDSKKNIVNTQNGGINLEGVDTKVEDGGANVKSTHCPICNVKFASGEAFEVHRRTCEESVLTGKKRYHCDLCGFDLSTPSNMRQHRLAVHLKCKPHICDICKACFAQATNLRVHLRYHTGERPYVCKQCGKAFASNKDLKTHIRFHSGERPYRCEECGRTFVTLSDKKVHQRKHTGECPYVCSWCDKAFPLRRNLVEHERRWHTGERPYVCQVCGAAFTTRAALKVHHRSHTGEQPFACSECPARYTDRSNLRAHRRRCHTHAGERPFPCAQCGATFTSRWTLSVHMHTHSDERPFVCGDCPRLAAFKTRSALTKHRRKCKDRKYFACDMCKEKFILKEEMKLHISKHADTAYLCNVCQEVCFTPSGLTRHMDKKHRQSEVEECSKTNVESRVFVKEELHEEDRVVVKIEDAESSSEGVREVLGDGVHDCEIIDVDIKEEKCSNAGKESQIVEVKNVSDNEAEIICCQDKSD